MQIMAEALGMAPARHSSDTNLLHYLEGCCTCIRRKSLGLAKEQLKPSDIMTMEASGECIMVHAAIAGSSNSLLYLPAIATRTGNRAIPCPVR